MATPSAPLIRLARNAQEGVIALLRECVKQRTTGWNIRGHLRNIDLAYMREQANDVETRLPKQQAKYGNSKAIQNITVPVVMPAVEAAVTYQTSVFLTGVPLFGVVSSPAYINEAIAMETVIDEQATYGGWALQLIMAFRDAFKYNIAFCDVPWCKEVVPMFDTPSTAARQADVKTTTWEGNKLVRVDPYNAFFDTRVSPHEIAEHGEFFGYSLSVSKTRLSTFLRTLTTTMNVAEAMNSGALTTNPVSTSDTQSGYYIPTLNASSLVSPENIQSPNWVSWFAAANPTKSAKLDFKNDYLLTKLYARIVPSELGLDVPAPNTPQIWLFYIVNEKVVVYAERQTNAHNLIPVLTMHPYCDGLGYQTKSLASNVEGFQQAASGLLNSALQARRRAVVDRVLFDPSRVSPSDINSPNPSAKIAVRPAAYGKPLSEAVFPFPFRDEASQYALQQVQQLQTMANAVTGQNAARQGQFVKGNKTQREFDTVMANANGRDQTTAIVLEAQFFTPLKQLLKTNILQYQGAGSLYNRQREEQVNIDPVKLRKAVLEFKISDGLVPSEKLIDGDSWTVGMQSLASSPALASEYNVGGVFSYLMKLKGADLTPFQKSPQQLAYEQALGAWRQAVGPALEAAAKNGTTPQLPPQPTPEQFGYDPRTSSPSPATNTPVQEATRVNNITNNITNNE